MYIYIYIYIYICICIYIHTCVCVCTKGGDSHRAEARGAREQCWSERKARRSAMKHVAFAAAQRGANITGVPCL